MCTAGLDPAIPPLPQHLGLYYKRALLVSQGRRHLFVTPCFYCSIFASLVPAETKLCWLFLEPSAQFSTIFVGLLELYWLCKEFKTYLQVTVDKEKNAQNALMHIAIPKDLPCRNAPLKGQCHEIFDFWFFSWISFHQSPEFTIQALSNFFWKFAEIFATLGAPPVSLTPVANGKNLQS
jgi:hypothetical protein